MKTKKPLIFALYGGICLSIFHIFWLLLISFGFAQPLMDFVFKIHMLNSPFVIQPFNYLYALILVIFTFIMGGFFGLLIYFLRKSFSVDLRAENKFSGVSLL